MTLDIQVHRVMNGHHYARRHQSSGHGLTVLEANTRCRYGLSNGHPNRSVKRIHLVSKVRTCWEGDRLVTLGAQWRCGTWSNEVLLFEHCAIPGATLCPPCLIRG